MESIPDICRSDFEVVRKDLALYFYAYSLSEIEFYFFNAAGEFYSDYHSGQNSPEYGKLSALLGAVGYCKSPLYDIESRDREIDQAIYNCLERLYNYPETVF